MDHNADGQVASVRFRVSAGGKEVFVSDVLRPGSRRSIDLPLDGAKTLDLTVDDGGDGRTWDQANWCDPRVVLADGTTLALDELAGQGGPDVGIPFSFVYGGKPPRRFRFAAGPARPGPCSSSGCTRSTRWPVLSAAVR